MSPAETMVSVRNVRRTFGAGATEVTALHDVSLEVGRGELVALIGRSGSGKTTLLNIVGGLDKADAGEVHVDGIDVATLTDDGQDELRRHTVAFIFQGFGLVPELSAAENVGLPLRLQRWSAEDRERRVSLLLDLVGQLVRGLLLRDRGHRRAKIFESTDRIDARLTLGGLRELRRRDLTERV